MKNFDPAKRCKSFNKYRSCLNKDCLLFHPSRLDCSMKFDKAYNRDRQQANQDKLDKAKGSIESGGVSFGLR